MRNDLLCQFRPRAPTSRPGHRAGRGIAPPTVGSISSSGDRDGSETTILLSCKIHSIMQNTFPLHFIFRGKFDFLGCRVGEILKNRVGEIPEELCIEGQEPRLDGKLDQLCPGAQL